ncbi:class I adenylate-forming enzyme family protein [Streptomyces griseoviridis]|nr:MULTISPECIES: class I adenylate-forming enzyme family protein [Streptomyces]AZS85898.1 long-chain fatty acid--CoA ligase [Streptomyces griseoviridis]
MLINTDGRRFSSAALDGAITAVVRELRRHGITQDDRVMLTGANTEKFVLVLFALMELGTSIALVDRRTPAAEQARLLIGADASRLVTDAPLPAGSTEIDQLSLEDLCATALARAAIADRAPDCGPASSFGRDRLARFSRWFAREDALIVWSSGSTGTPKGIVRSGASVRANTERTSARMAYRATDVLLPLLPFTHQYGLSMLLLWQDTGCALVLQTSSQRVDAALAAIRSHRVTVVDAVPATYHTLLNLLESGRGSEDWLSTVRMWCVGGEPLGSEPRQRFADRIGRPLLDGYGSSEAGNIALAVPPTPIGCGRPLQGIAVRVVDGAGMPVAPGTVGEIVVRTPDYMTGLLGPGGTVLAMEHAEYRTDDIGQIDVQGNLTVLGRRAAVHRLGHTLYPDGIADRASACGALVRVIPVVPEGSDSRAQLVFFVADRAERSAAHWRSAVAEHIAEHERPNRVVVVPEFPINRTGKVDRQSLQRLAESAVARDAKKGELQ